MSGTDSATASISVSILNITNGESAKAVMQRAGVVGEIFCWHDVLHEGPVPKTRTLRELSSIRASFIADQGWGDPVCIRKTFLERDTALMHFRDHQRLVLWFEHDLYDQLQLLQILHWLATEDRGTTEVGLICVDEYLGEMTADRMGSLTGLSIPVSTAQMQLALSAWDAFRSPDPINWYDLLKVDSSSLPFFHDACVRHLQQFPSLKTGLNRTESQILQAVAAGHVTLFAIFAYNQQADGVKFMGDTCFWKYVENMCDSEQPLLCVTDHSEFNVPRSRPYPEAFLKQQFRLTKIGNAVLGGDRDWLSIKSIDKWYGGVRLVADNIWRWDGVEYALTKTG